MPKTKLRYLKAYNRHIPKYTYCRLGMAGAATFGTGQSSGLNVEEVD